MPSRQINDFIQKGNRKKIELVSRPVHDFEAVVVEEEPSASLLCSQEEIGQGQPVGQVVGPEHQSTKFDRVVFGPDSSRLETLDVLVVIVLEILDLSGRLPLFLPGLESWVLPGRQVSLFGLFGRVDRDDDRFPGSDCDGVTRGHHCEIKFLSVLL